MRRARWAAAAVAAMAVTAPAATAAEPALRTAPSKLRAALTCDRSVAGAARTPVLLVTGSGVDGREAWPVSLQRPLRAAGVPTCFVDLPRHTTEDLQVSAEFLVAAIRTTARRARRPVALYAIDQGGLLARWALAFWPSLRPKVPDVVSVAGTLHGTTLYRDLLEVCGRVCHYTAAFRQQAAGSRFLDALEAKAPAAQGPTAWTTVRSRSDEIVVPADGDRPASALAGAANLVIQDVCPGRTPDHITTAVDSVSYAALLDAVAQEGPAAAARLPADVCARPFAPGLPERATRARVRALYRRAAPRTADGADGGKVLTREPPLRPYAR